jgi:hypothetical protein
MTSLRIRSFGLIAFAAAALAGPLAGAAQADTPTTTGSPTISGTAAQGQTLQVAQATWTTSTPPTTVTDQWVYCTSPVSSSCNSTQVIATGGSYPLTASDVGKDIGVIETAQSTDLTTTPPTTFTSTPSTSTPVGPVIGPPTRGALTISGAATQGTTLTSNGGAGNWTNSPSTTDHWYDCPTNAVTTACASIATASTGTTYQVQAGDGPYIYLSESASNAAGTGTANSNLIGPIVAVPVNSGGGGLPSISGSTVTGQTLTANPGSWTNSPTSYNYQWQRCTTSCINVGAASATNTYPLTTSDLGDTIEVVVTATNGAGASTPATSAPTSTVVPPAPSYNAAPGISGTTESGQTLTETSGSWPGYTGKFTIQWYRCAATCTAVTGATGATYPLTDADVGAQMQVTQTATNAGGSTTAPSSLTDPIKKNGFVPVPVVTSGSVPTIAGTLQLGQTLTASSASFTINNPSSFSYQWLRCNALGCSPIPGATDVTYTPTSADVGDSIAFAETASNSGGPSDPVQSSRTDTVTAPSTTALQTNASAPVAGQTVTLIATVTSAAGSIKPAGTVDFQAGAAAIPGCTGLALGNSAPTAVCQTSFPASVANVTAAYSAAPGTFITGSTSSPTTLTIGRAATTVTVAASAHVSLGNRTTYTATVQPPAGSSLTATGRVTFTDKGKSIKGCGSKALAANRAPCSVKYLGLKQHRIAARYSGDANFAPSASLTSHVLVQPQTPSGFVAVFMNWSFNFELHATRIASLSASGLSAGIHIAVTCRGDGCPFAHRAMTVSTAGKCGKAAKTGCVAGSSFNLTPIFHRAHLRVGTQLTVAITHRGWVGKYYRFTIRAGHKPAIGVSCLAVNGTRPGVGCSAR